MQCQMQKRSVFNFILSNYILASVLITTTNHITTRNSYRYPRAHCLFSLQVPSSARKGTLVTSDISTSYFLKIEVAYSTLFVAQTLLILFTRGQFWPSGIVVACVCVCVCVSVCLSVCQSLACPRDNSGPVQARIAKFGPKMQKTLVKVPIVFGANWPWPSRSNLT